MCNNLRNKAEINCQEKKQKSHAKYVGVTIDSWLSWLSPLMTT